MDLCKNLKRFSNETNLDQWIFVFYKIESSDYPYVFKVKNSKLPLEIRPENLWELNLNSEINNAGHFEFTIGWKLGIKDEILKEMLLWLKDNNILNNNAFLHLATLNEIGFGGDIGSTLIKFTKKEISIYSKDMEIFDTYYSLEHENFMEVLKRFFDKSNKEMNTFKEILYKSIEEGGDLEEDYSDLNDVLAEKGGKTNYPECELCGREIEAEDEMNKCENCGLSHCSDCFDRENGLCTTCIE
jgi:hypothetical protein